MSSLTHALRRFSIRFRMNGAIVIVIGLFGLVAAAGLLGGHSLSTLNQEFMHHSVKEQRTITDIRTALGAVRQHEKDMVIDYEDTARVQAHRAAWTQAVANTKAALATLIEGEEDDDNAEAREAIKGIDAYAAASARVIEQIQAGAYDTARVADRMLSRAKQHIVEVEQRVAKIDEIVVAEITNTRIEFEASMQRTMMLFVAVLLLVVLVVVPATLLNSRSITLPILRARDIASAIAQGDLTQRMSDKGADAGNDETSDLLRALEHMRSSLAALVGDVRNVSDNIGVSSGEVASGNVDLSQRTEQTASNLQLTASSIEELTVTVKQSADAASQANQLATSAANVAQRGGQVVSQVVATMNDINTSSRKISDIIGTIDGIAFQTNILALNAAVEAARAGEQGRGFAVVAGEVRSLAQRSAEAAREIKSLIGASVERVEAGSKLVQDAGGTMGEIVASVQRVSDIIAEISAAAGEQSQGIGQVNTAVNELDRMTQQNAALVEQSAAAAQSLRDQAGKLTQVVASFRIDGAARPLPAAAQTARNVPTDKPADKPTDKPAGKPARTARPELAPNAMATATIQKAAQAAVPPPAGKPAKAAKPAAAPARKAEPVQAPPAALAQRTQAAQATTDEWETF